MYPCRFAKQIVYKRELRAKYLSLLLECRIHFNEQVQFALHLK
jgi:hypothetical protein